MSFKHGDHVLLPDVLGGAEALFDRYQHVTSGLPVLDSELFASHPKSVAIVHLAGDGTSLALYADTLRPVPLPKPGPGHIHTDSAGARYVNIGETGDEYTWVRIGRPNWTQRLWYTWEEIRDR
jgi:hypothetical protein